MAVFYYARAWRLTLNSLNVFLPPHRLHLGVALSRQHDYRDLQFSRGLSKTLPETQLNL